MVFCCFFREHLKLFTIPHDYPDCPWTLIRHCYFDSSLMLNWKDEYWLKYYVYFKYKLSSSYVNNGTGTVLCKIVKKSGIWIIFTSIICNVSCTGIYIFISVYLMQPVLETKILIHICWNLQCLSVIGNMHFYLLLIFMKI